MRASVLLLHGNSSRLNLWTDKDLQLLTETEQDLFRRIYKTHITIRSIGIKPEVQQAQKPKNLLYQNFDEQNLDYYK